MNATQTSLFIQQVFLAGPLSLKESYPALSLAFTISILIFLMSALLLRLSRNAHSLKAVLSRIFAAWALSSYAMIAVAYIGI